MLDTEVQEPDHLRAIPYATANTFLGTCVSQSFSGLYWLEKFLALHQPKAILELGTGPGTLTCLFGLHCPGHVITTDLHSGPGATTGECFDRLGISYVQQDVLDPEFAFRVMYKETHRPLKRPLFVFCDAGNKQAEFALYAPMLKDGDAIAVHDFDVEFHLTKEAERIIETHNLVRYFEESVSDGSLLGFWVKGGLPNSAER